MRLPLLSSLDRRLHASSSSSGGAVTLLSLVAAFYFHGSFLIAETRAFTAPSQKFLRTRPHCVVCLWKIPRRVLVHVGSRQVVVVVACFAAALAAALATMLGHRCRCIDQHK